MHKSTLWLLFYFVVLSLYALWSYSLTDPNLVLSSWPPYWNFQQWMWQTFFSNPQLLTYSYIGLIIAALIGWYKAAQSLPAQTSYKKVLCYALLLSFPLWFSYNALSHDVFNYIFNAKMVVVYQEDPHVSVALNHPDDLWTRFMHNTHTPAPYGYGWTAFSLFPYMIGMGKFLFTWLVFRGMNVVALCLVFALLIKLARSLYIKTTPKDFALLFFHPLLLIEVISNSHNDLWMLIPALASLLLVLTPQVKKSGWKVFLSLLLLLLSISTKMATIVLLPIWLIIVWHGLNTQLKWLHFLPRQLKRWVDVVIMLTIENLGFIASVLLFFPLFSSRSQLFHPWYLLWAFSWLPLIRVSWWKAILLAFSVSSLFRYVPWIFAGGFEGNVLLQQQAVTWLGAVVGLGLVLSYKRCFRS